MTNTPDDIPRSDSGDPESTPEQPRTPRYAPPRYRPPQPLPQPAPYPQHPYPTSAPQQHPPQSTPPGAAQQPPHPYPYAAPQPPAQAPYTPAYIPGPPGPGEPFDGAADPRDLQRPLYGANIAQAFVRFFANYANFSGRASRSEFWWMALITWGAFILLGIIVGIIDSVSAASPFSGSSEVVAGIFGMLFLVVFLGILVPWLAIGWRRLHDANLAGPLYLLSLVPYVGGLVVFVFTLLPPRPEGRRFDQPRRA